MQKSGETKKCAQFFVEIEFVLGDLSDVVAYFDDIHFLIST